MELRMMQNRAIYAVRRMASKGSERNELPAGAEPTESLATVRTSVGEFAFRSTQVGCYLELIVGKLHRVLGLYQTNEAALDALINQRTGLGSWDALVGSAAKSQVAALKKWDPDKQAS